MTKVPEYKLVPQSSILRSPSISLNLSLGADKGFREGSVVMYYGPEGSLKTSNALEMCREAQTWRPDLATAYIDVEHRVDIAVAASMGVAMEPFEDSGVPRFVYRKPQTAEKAWEYARKFANSGAFSIIVIDSVAAMRTEAQMESDEVDMGQVGAAARLTSAQLPMVAVACEETGTILWCLNQLRIVQIKPQVKKGFPGGNAWNFYTTHIIKTEWVEKAREMETTDLHILPEKVKYGPPMRPCEVPVILGHGIDREKDLLRHAIRLGLIKKAGSWYSLVDDTKIGQGEDKASDYLRENLELAKTLEEQIYAASP